jgi:flagellar biosynthesis protein FlhG
VVEAYPTARSSASFKKIAQAADNWPIDNAPSGHVQFFFERLVRGQQPVSARVCA